MHNNGFGPFYRKLFDRKPLYRNGHLTESSFDRNGHFDWSMQDHTISRYDVLIGDEI
jgi:hypothetical protein